MNDEFNDIPISFDEYEDQSEIWLEMDITKLANWNFSEAVIEQNKIDATLIEAEEITEGKMSELLCRLRQEIDKLNEHIGNLRDLRNG